MDVLRQRFRNVVAATIGRFEGYRESPTRIVQQTPGIVNVAASEAPDQLARAGIDSRAGGSDEDVLWEKLARQGPIALLTSALGRTIGELRSDPRLRAAVEEACAVAAADGAHTTFAEQWAIIESLPDWADLVDGARRNRRATVRARRDRRRRRTRGPPARRAYADALEELLAAMPSVIALIGARSGSERVADKNIRPLAGHPLLAYAIATAQQSGVCERVVVSTDSEAIADVARWYGAEVPFLRPAEYATSTSPDIEWITFTLERLPEQYDLFAIVRATNPFRGPDVVRRGLEQLLATPEADSVRAVELVKQHPGKMWQLADDGRTMAPLLDQSHLDVAWHAGQYQALPRVYHQNSALEIAWTRVVTGTGTREGRVLAPFLTEGLEGFNVDDEADWERAEALVASGAATLTEIDRAPYEP